MPQNIDAPTIGIETLLFRTAVVEQPGGAHLGTIFDGGVIKPNNLPQILEMKKAEGFTVLPEVYKLLNPILQASHTE